MLYSYLPDKEKTIKNLLSVDYFPPHIISVFLQNVSKIFTKLGTDPNYSRKKLSKLCLEMEESIKPHLKNQNLEIQERATTLSELITIAKSIVDNNSSKNEQNLLMNENGDPVLSDPVESQKDPNFLELLESYYYAYPLNCVAAKAQSKVPIPVGLDLDVLFEVSESEDESEEFSDSNEKVLHLVDDEPEVDEEVPEKTDKKAHSTKQSRKFDQENNPNYLKSTKKKTGKKSKITNSNSLFENNVNDTENAIDVLNEQNIKTKPTIPGLTSSEKYLLQMKKTAIKKEPTSKKSKGKKKKKKNQKLPIEEDDDDEEMNGKKISIRALEMPEGADLNDNEEETPNNLI